MMAPSLSSLNLVFTILMLAVYATPVPPSQTNSTQRSEPNTVSSDWSKEEIFTFIGVLIAITGITITLFLSSTKLRQWVCSPFRCK
jgi:hypothetical protein